MTLTLDKLPDNPIALKALLLDQQTKLDDQQKKIQGLQSVSLHPNGATRLRVNGAT